MHRGMLLLYDELMNLVSQTWKDGLLLKPAITRAGARMRAGTVKGRN
jgi:hypothetical protein